MPYAPRRTRTRHSISLVVLAATLGLAAMAVSQCKMVTDRVTGLTLTPGRLSARSSCVKDCQEKFEAAFREEAARYLEALRACGTDPTCRAEENERHMIIVDQIVNARRDCKKACYNEGGGTSQ